MDILRLVAVVKLGILSMLFAAFLPDRGYATSIFEMILGIQPKICSSLIIPEKQSIIDPNVIHPPAISERLNYEYTITTPNYPSNYPTDIQCITLIKAPNYDYNIILEVRQLFDIEPSQNCFRDFLEITDGPYGFSKRIGRYCNVDKPPREIRSTGPFLWLRFRSDNSLPHNGSKIVYRFNRNTKSEPITDYCYNQVMIPPGRSFNLNTSYLVTEMKNSLLFQNNKTFPLECIFDFHVTPGFKTFVYKASYKKPNFALPCPLNSFDIYYRGTFENRLLNPKKLNYLQFCEEGDFTQKLFDRSTRTTVRIIVTDITKLNIVSIIMTSVKQTGDPCPSDFFLCSKTNNLCISKSLQCDGEVNCPEMTDEKCVGSRPLSPGEERNITTTIDPIQEKKEKAKKEEDKLIYLTNRTHAIILGSIASVLVISMLFCLLLTIHSKKKDKETRRVNVVDVPVYNQDKTHNKNLFYELLQSSEPSVAALSTEKLSRKLYNDNQIWSKRPFNDSSNPSAHRHNDSNVKLNGGIKSDSTIKSTSIHPFKSKVDTTKGSSMNRIGKYLSVPYPAKNDVNPKPTIQIQPFNITSPSEDFQSWSSNSFSKQNSSMNRSMHHIQRASSMGSGLRRQLQEPVAGEDPSKNVEWYCGPVVRGSTNPNNSSETLNAYSAKSSQHVPGCRSLPNFSNIGLQNPVYYTKPSMTHTSAYNNEQDSLDCSADDNSSYREDTPSFSVQNHYQKSNNSHKHPDMNRHDGGPSSHYGFKYFCAHEPMSGNDFVEYIA